MSRSDMAAPRRRHAAGRPVLLVLLGVAAMLSALAGNAMANGQSIEGFPVAAGGAAQQQPTAVGCIKYVATVNGPVGRPSANQQLREHRRLSAEAAEPNGNATAPESTKFTDGTDAVPSNVTAAGTGADDSVQRPLLRDVPASKDGVVYLVDLDLSSLLAASGSKQHQQQQQTKSQQVQDLSQQEGAAVPTALQFALPDGNTVALTVSNLVASNHNNKAAFTASSKASGQSDATSKSAQDQAPKDGQQQQQQAPKPLCAKRLKGKGEDVCLEQQQQGASAAVTEECETWEGVGAKGTGGSSGVFTRCGNTWSGSVFGPDYRMWVFTPAEEQVQVQEQEQDQQQEQESASNTNAKDASSAKAEADKGTSNLYYLFEAVDVEGDGDRTPANGTAPGALKKAAQGLGTRRALQGGNCNADEGNYAYVNVYYTDDVSLSRADAENQVAITNSALRRAGAGFELVLLRFERVHSSWHRNKDMDAALYGIQDPNRGWYSPPDGMDGTAADLVMLVTPPGKYCGIAWIGGRTSVVGIDCFRSLSFAHELGHNFGGYHNREEHPGNTHPYAYAPWAFVSAHWDGSVYSPNDGVISILSYDNPCRTYKGSYCNRVPQYGHNGDTVDIVISGHSHVRQFGNAANDLGRVFRERKWNTVNFGVHTCDRYWPDQQYDGYTSNSCWVPVSMSGCNDMCNQDAACMGVDWYQGSQVCCKIYGSNAGGLRLKASTTPGSWGRVFAKRRGALADNRLPGGMACVPNKGAATHWWSNANSACMASAGASTTAYTIRTSTAVNKCVDVPNAQVTTNGVGLWQWDCNGTPAQSFYLVPSGDLGYYYIRTTGGKCWDVPGGSTGDGTSIALWTCGNSDNQKFAVVPTTVGSFTLRPKHAGMASCVDVSGAGTAAGTKIQLWWCNNSGAQRFTFA